ncbi:MAG: 30S ribosome-binding factor RbfA [Roseimicrobium sp.]
MTHRVQRVQELIRREIGTILERNFKFTGSIATVHEVSLTPDLKQCFIYIGVLGNGDAPESIIKRLNDGRGLIQRDLYKRVILKNSPSLVFKFDDSIERGVRVLSLIENLPSPALIDEDEFDPPIADEPTLVNEDAPVDEETEEQEEEPQRKKRRRR